MLIVRTNERTTQILEPACCHADRGSEEIDRFPIRTPHPQPLAPEYRGEGSQGDFGAPTSNTPGTSSPKSWPVRLWYGLCAVLEWLFGLASLLLTLALVAAIPVANLVSFGYLLDASGRVANSGRLRDGFVDIAKFSRIGS